MTRYTPEQIEAGARAMYEKCASTAYEDGMVFMDWDEMLTEDREKECAAFAAGVATLPDHIAELLETIDRMREIDRLKERLDWYAEHGPAETHDKLCKQLDTLAAQIATAIANAKTQTKGGATG